MATTPAGNAAQHLERLRSQIAEYLPQAYDSQFCFYDLRSAAKLFHLEVVPEKCVIDSVEFSQVLERIVSENCAWINVSGEGFLVDGRFVCSFDKSNENGPSTVVDVCGPTLQVDGEPRKSAEVAIGLLEYVAEGLPSSAQPSLANKILATYDGRTDNNWNTVEFGAFTSAELRQITQQFKRKIEFVATEDSFDQDLARAHCASLQKLVDQLMAK